MLIRDHLKNMQSLRGVANRLQRALFVSVGDGQPLFVPDDPEQYVKDAFQYNPDVYSVVSLIARSAAAVPWIVYEVKDKKALKRYKRLPSEAKRHNLARVVATKAKALEETESDNDLTRLLDRPNPYQGGHEFRENVFGFKLITGNAYIHGVKYDIGRLSGRIGEMWVMPSQLTEIVASNDPEHIIRGYRLNWYGVARELEIPADEVLHMKYFNPNYDVAGSHLYGQSPLMAARRVVTRSNEAYSANAKMLKSMQPPGILMFDDDAVEGFDADAASMLERNYVDKTGSANAGKMLVTTAKFKYQQLGLSPVDLNIIESQKMDLRDICNVYGISSELLNDPDNKTNSNKAESRKALYYERIIPELDSFRDELNRWIVPAYGANYYIDYDLSSIPALQDDMEKVTTQLSNAWWITGNEKRAVQGYDHDPLLDRYFIPSNLIPLDSDMFIDNPDNEL
jgi:HK97 family phage portal protein